MCVSSASAVYLAEYILLARNERLLACPVAVGAGAGAVQSDL